MTCIQYHILKLMLCWASGCSSPDSNSITLITHLFSSSSSSFFFFNSLWKIKINALCNFLVNFQHTRWKDHQTIQKPQTISNKSGTPYASRISTSPLRSFGYITPKQSKNHKQSNNIQSGSKNQYPFRD
jgi:hypothetical protein